MTNNSQPKEIQDKINRIKKEMLDKTNMTENEAYDFAFKCWQCGLDFTKDLEKENQELKEKAKKYDELCSHNVMESQSFGDDLIQGILALNKRVIERNKKLEKAIKILKPILDIYAGEGKGYIDCCVENPIITFDLYNDKEFKLYNLLKEVLGDDE